MFLVLIHLLLQLSDAHATPLGLVLLALGRCELLEIPFVAGILQYTQMTAAQLHTLHITQM